MTSEPRRRHEGFDAPHSLTDPTSSSTSILPSNYLDTTDLLSDEPWSSRYTTTTSTAPPPLQHQQQQQQQQQQQHHLAHSAPATRQLNAHNYPYQQRTFHHQQPLQSVPSGMVPEDIIMRDWNDDPAAGHRAQAHSHHPATSNFPSAGESMTRYVSARDCLTPEHDYHSLGLAGDDHFQHFLHAAATASASLTDRRDSVSMTTSQTSGSTSVREDDSPTSLSGASLSTCGTPATSIGIASPKAFSHAGSLPRSSSLSSRQHARNRSSVSSVSQVLERSSSRARASTTTVNLQGAPIVGSASQEGGKVPTQRSRPSRRASVGPAAQAAALNVANSLPGAGLRIDASGASAVIGPTGVRRSGPLSARAPPSASYVEEQRGRTPAGWGSISISHHQGAFAGEPYSAGSGCLQSPSMPNSALGTSPFQASNFHDSMHRLHLQSPPLDNNMQLHSSQMQQFSQPPQQEQGSFADFINTPRDQQEAYKHEEFNIDNFFDETGGVGTQEHVSPDSTRNHSAAELRASLSVSPTPANDPDTAPTSGPASVGPGSVSAHDDASTSPIVTIAGAEDSANLTKIRQPSKSTPSKSKAQKERTKVEEDEFDDWVADQAAEEEDEGSVRKGKGARIELSAAEKRRRRRESHNAVERRRRDNINERITELAGLLPESMLLEAIAASKQGGYDQFNPTAAIEAIAAASALREASEAASNARLSSTTGAEARRLMVTEQREFAHCLAPVAADSAALAAAQARPNKGIILQKTCEYVQTLQTFLTSVMKTNAELAQRLDDALGGSVGPQGDKEMAISLPTDDMQRESINRSLNVGVKVEPLSPVLDHSDPHPHKGVQESSQDIISMDIYA